MLGAVIGYLTLWLFAKIFLLITKKEGMGHGDFKLFALLGAWLGWQVLPLILIIASFLGATVGIAMMLIKHQDRNTAIPFGPYLALAGWITMLFGQQIMQFYLQIAGL